MGVEVVINKGHLDFSVLSHDLSAQFPLNTVTFYTRESQMKTLKL